MFSAVERLNTYTYESRDGAYRVNRSASNFICARHAVVSPESIGKGTTTRTTQFNEQYICDTPNNIFLLFISVG